MALTDKLVSIADSIRAKTGGTEPLTLDEMATAIEGIETGGGGGGELEALADKTITEASFKEITAIPSNFFNNCKNLTRVSAPKVTSLGEKAFYYCSLLSELNTAPIKSISGEALAYCSKLTSLDFSELTTVAAKCMSYSGIKTLVAPKLAKANSSAFDNMRSLKFVSLPVLTSVPSQCFYQCFGIEKMVLPICTSINSRCFYNCSKMQYLVLASETLCTLSDTSAFNVTPFALEGYTGKCYVPRALIESYQTATNWSTLYAAGTCVFLPLEDYTVDGTTTGEIDWDKIEGVTE